MLGIEKLLGKATESIINKSFNDETLAPKITEMLEKYPLKLKEKKNVIVIEVENEVIYASICGRYFNPMTEEFVVSNPKEQKKLIPFLKELINLAKKGVSNE